MSYYVWRPFVLFGARSSYQMKFVDLFTLYMCLYYKE